MKLLDEEVKAAAGASVMRRKERIRMIDDR